MDYLTVACPLEILSTPCQAIQARVQWTVEYNTLPRLRMGQAGILQMMGQALELELVGRLTVLLQ